MASPRNKNNAKRSKMINENHRIELIRKSGKKAILNGIVTAQYVLETVLAAMKKNRFGFDLTLTFFVFMA
jgi:hypothetical protein